jgi:TM2 domain-containing membrane protein YozV
VERHHEREAIDHVRGLEGRWRETVKRTSDPEVIEHRLLELAYTTDAKITPSVLAFFVPCSIEDAEKVLDDLTARERIEMEVDDDGRIFYIVPDRQKLEIQRESAPQQLIRLGHVPLAIRRRSPSPLLAAGLSMLIPGAGQLYAGRIVSAILWFMVVSAGYALILPGLILHLFCMASAARQAASLDAEMQRLQLTSG